LHAFGSLAKGKRRKEENEIELHLEERKQTLTYQTSWMPISKKEGRGIEKEDRRKRRGEERDEEKSGLTLLQRECVQHDRLLYCTKDMNCLQENSKKVEDEKKEEKMMDGGVLLLTNFS
jgi:hypothetical protein